jgi:hypothetical protein
MVAANYELLSSTFQVIRLLLMHWLKKEDIDIRDFLIPNLQF